MWFHRIVTDSSESLPTDLATAHAMILAERVEAEALAANARADLSSTEALIGRLKLEIEKLRRQLYGTRSERTARLLEQIELQLEELEATATEDELAAEQVVARSQAVQSFQRKRPSDRGTERAAVMATLIMTALCRARHRAVYAARRTMPSRVVFPRFLADRRLVGSA